MKQLATPAKATYNGSFPVAVIGWDGDVAVQSRSLIDRASGPF
jgi:hypothetical protein